MEVTKVVVFFFFFTDDLLCSAQPDSSICVGVFLHGVWENVELTCLLTEIWSMCVSVSICSQLKLLKQTTSDG